MRKLTSALLVVASCALAAPAVAAGNYKVVGHAATTPDSASAKDLSRIFLKQKSSWPGGQKADPVDQKRDATVRREFSDGVLGKPVSMVESHWQAQVFSGKGTPPKTLASDQEVINFVRSHPGGVGYVTASASTEGVKVIRVVN
jgi:hypothetical protein